MKRTAIVIVVVIAVGLVGYEYYEHRYISSDLRRSLLAVCDSHTTWTDEQQYMREARLQVRTARDREVFSSFQDAVANLYRYSHCGEDLTSSLDQANLQSQNLHMRVEANLIGQRSINALTQSIRLQIDEAKSTYDQCQAHEQEAQTLFSSVRDRYGLKE